MSNPSLLPFVVVVAAIAFAWSCGLLARRVGQPAVIGELLAGIVLGPSVFGVLWPELAHRVFGPQAIATIGFISRPAILIFMFLVGLELDTTVLLRHARGVARIAVASLLLPFSLGWPLAVWLYPSFHGAVANRPAFLLFVGTAMSITALPVLSRILADMRLLQTTVGIVAVGCSAIDDIVAWTMLGIVVGLTNGQGNFPMLITSIVGYLVGLLQIVRPALGWLASQRGRGFGEPAWFLALATVLAGSAFVAERIGIHAVFGGLMAGMCVPRKSSALSGLEQPLRWTSTLLLPAFFVLIGLKTEIGSIAGATDWAITALIVAGAIFGKIGGATFAARTLGFSGRDALSIGVLLNTRGLVELVALDIGRTLGILSPRLFTMFVLMTLLTTLATVPLLRLLGVRPEPVR